MRWPYPLIVAIALIIAIALLLTAIGSLTQLYGAIATISPLLAQLILAIIILALIGALIIIARYVWLFLRPKRKRTITLPTAPDEVATVSLQATQQQVAQIQDEISRQALAAQSEHLTRRMALQTFQIVVFGLGSTGKTALVNALIGEIAGNVAATIGTTEQEQTYRVVLNDGKELLITDTPGLLEAGALGEARSQEARSLAAKADLLLFVIDNDLHRAEYEPLAMLMDMGKRSLLVFNKSDRYLPTEKEQILQRLRKRTQHLLKREDVIAVSALPSPAPLPDVTYLQPDPDVSNLIERVLTILNHEGTNLIASNILLQSQQLSKNAQALLNTQRRTQADAIIDRYQWVGAGVLAATPLPVVDMLATAAVNAQMVVELGRVYGVEVSIVEAKALARSLAKTMAGLSIAKGAMKMLAVGLQANLATAVASKLLQGVSAAYLTRIAGKSFVTYFQENQDWGDGGIQSVVAKQYQLNQRSEFVGQFLRSAVARLA